MRRIAVLSAEIRARSASTACADSLVSFKNSSFVLPPDTGPIRFGLQSPRSGVRVTPASVRSRPRRADDGIQMRRMYRSDYEKYID